MNNCHFNIPMSAITPAEIATHFMAWYKAMSGRLAAYERLPYVIHAIEVLRGKGLNASQEAPAAVVARYDPIRGLPQQLRHQIQLEKKLKLERVKEERAKQHITRRMGTDKKRLKRLDKLVKSLKNDIRDVAHMIGVQDRLLEDTDEAKVDERLTFIRRRNLFRMEKIQLESELDQLSFEKLKLKFESRQLSSAMA